MSIDLAWVQQQFPNYTSLAPLGQGGQRVVLAGHHESDGDIVLKLLYPGSELRRVLREIDAVKRVVSPRIPCILASGIKASPIGDLAWICESRIHGTDLRAVLNDRHTLPPDDIQRLALQMLEALTAAEAVRIVHRDVKPDNIKVDTQSNYWLLDFGLARHLDLTSLTASGNPFGVGTAGYAPPEQARNRKEEIDGRADLFALGVTLYECAEGRNPLRLGARDDLEIRTRTETQALPRIRQSVGLSVEFVDLVYTMTRPRRDHRPATVADALAWMQEIVSDH